MFIKTLRSEVSEVALGVDFCTRTTRRDVTDRRLQCPHLAIELNKPKYLWLTKPNSIVEPHDPDLTDDEKRLLMAAAADRNGQILTGNNVGGFFAQSNDENFVEDFPRSAAAWKRVLKRLVDLGYLSRGNGGIYEMTEEGFARADKEIAATPLEVSLSVTGTPDKQILSAESSRPIILKQLDFLMSSEAYITRMELNEPPGTTTMISLDPGKIVELFNAPRPDKNYVDHAGSAALRLVFMTSGRRAEILLPILLQPMMLGNTQWIKLVGSKSFTVK
jgi:hypothetical protein